MERRGIPQYRRRQVLRILRAEIVYLTTISFCAQSRISTSLRSFPKNTRVRSLALHLYLAPCLSFLFFTSCDIFRWKAKDLISLLADNAPCHADIKTRRTAPPLPTTHNQSMSMMYHNIISPQ